MISCESEEELYKDAADYAGILPDDKGHKDAIDNLMAEGRTLYKAEDFEAAKTVFFKVKTLDSQMAEPSFVKHAANNLSACMLHLGDHEGALEHTGLVLKVDPGNVKALCRRWLSYSQMGRSDEADSIRSNLHSLGLGDEMLQKEDAYIEAVAVNTEPKEQRERCDQLRKEGNTMMTAGRNDDAIQLYTAALKERPLDSATSNNRAQAYLRLKRYEEAEKDADVVLQSDPRNLRAIFRRSRARLGLPQPNEEGGYADLARVISETPGNDEANDPLRQAVKDIYLDGNVSVPNDDSCSAPAQVAFQSHYGADRQAATKYPGSLMIVEEDESDGCSWCPLVPDERERDGQTSLDCGMKGEQHRKRNNWAQALETFTQGVVADPSNAACWIGLSRVHREQGNYRESSEAAFCAENMTPKGACTCLAVVHLLKNTALTHNQRVQYVRGVWSELEKIRCTGFDKAHPCDYAEEEAILSEIVPPLEA